MKCTIWRHSVGPTLPVFLEDFESIACLASEQKLIESHVIQDAMIPDFINLVGSIHTHNGLTAKSKGYFMLTK